MGKITKLTTCRICGNKDLKVVFDLGKHSLSGRFPGKDEADPMKAPLVLVRCNDKNNKDACGLLQLQHQVEPDELYQHNYGYFSGISKTMVTHLAGLVDQILKRNILKKGDLIVDIGSNDATMLKMYSSNFERIGIDPTGEQFKEYYPNNIKLYPDYFTKANFNKISKRKAKVITSIACFYDLPNPVGFAKDVKDCLDQNGIWIFEQSYMPFMLKTKSMDTICNEHLEYYSLKSIKYLLDKAGMKIIDVNFNDSNGGSFRVTATHVENPMKPEIKIALLLAKEKRAGLDTPKPYKDFFNNSEKVKKHISKYLTEIKAKGKSIYIYGASTKGNTLLQYCGIGKKLIVAAAERNPEKYGRRTPGTNIPIISEKEARAAKPDYFIVLPWHFRDEIIKREKDYLLSGGKLIFPLPKFEIVSKEDIVSQDDD